MPSYSTLNNFHKTEVALLPRETNPEIADNVIQAICRLLGWDATSELWRMLRVDALGRLIVATDTGTFSSFTTSKIEVTVANTTLLNASTTRRLFAIKNLGPSTIFVASGALATVNDYPVDSGNSLTIDDYIGALSAITAAGVADIRIIEV